MTAADRPSVPRVGDTITTAEQLDALPLGAVVEDKHGDVALRYDAQSWLFPETATMLTEYVAKHYAPLTVRHVPGEPSRSFVTDNARAMEIARTLAHTTELTGAEARTIADAALAMSREEAAGRAETTTSTATLMARRGGKTQALIESLLSQAKDRGLTVEVVYPETTTAKVELITEPYDGHEPDAACPGCPHETTTATDEDSQPLAALARLHHRLIDQMAEALGLDPDRDDDCVPECEDGPGGSEHLLWHLIQRATARTRPTETEWGVRSPSGGVTPWGHREISARRHANESGHALVRREVTAWMEVD